MNEALAVAPVPSRPPPAAWQACDRIIAESSKSFALAARLMPPALRPDIAATYAFCRRADDAVDGAVGGAARTALARLRGELASVYAGDPQTDPVLVAFQDVVRRRAIPRSYLEDLLAGMAMDAQDAQYRTLEDLMLYCHRVAGVVGLLLCHVMDVRTRRALPHAAHLGMGMQLTNICRDVAEDAERGRCYLPAALRGQEPLPRVIRRLLDEADRFYRSGDRGLRFLPWRCAVAVRAARLIYAAIGEEIRRRGYDVLSGRAVVPRRRKLVLAAWALLLGLSELPGRWLRALRPRPSAASALLPPLEFPDDVLPV